MLTLFIDTYEEQVINENWIFKSDDKKIPVVFCVNSKSGGQKGEEILASFYKFLNPLQVNLYLCFIR